MKSVDAIKAIMNKQGIGTNKIADRLGRPSSTISDRIRQENISISKLNEILRVLDYKIVVVPRETVEAEDWYKIE